MRYSAGLFLTAAFWGLLSSAHAADDSAFRYAVSICAAISNPQAFDGKYLLFKAEYRQEPHGAVLTGHGCPKTTVMLTRADDYSESPAMRTVVDSSINKASWLNVVSFDVVYGATFRTIRGIRCSEVHCFRYELDASKLIAVRPLSRASE
ncbi:MAG TPA: hypothetical protein VMF67_11400 [Rhizomicrobium sp.]|nr:hypothetical protein [Rhizomicrobium sp.]